MTSGERGEVAFGRRTLRYTVQRSERRRTVGIAVSAQGVTVLAPQAASAEILAGIVQGRGAWVISKQIRFSALREAAPRVQSFKDGSALLYLGRQCRLWRTGNLARTHRNGRRLEVPHLDEASLTAELERWYREQAVRVINQRVKFYARRLGTQPSAILIRDQRTRWGSCNAKGELRFNWRIVMAPMTLVDYVVAHELCHLEHMHHGPAFWKRLAEVLPDYEQRRERLALEGMKYVL